MALSGRERAIRLRLKADLEHYARACLKIRTKAGTIEPLIFNRMQCYLHAKIEDHARRSGRVRMLILKARQQGCSTYVGARFYHKATHARGQQVFILTHEQDATDNLFDMAVRFHEHCPSLVKPHTGASNAKELAFDVLDSGYSVGTAGSKAVGRSKTLQLFLGSEVAHWPNAASHFAGVMQAVPDLAGTEIILESTGSGPGGEFHERYQQAEAGIGDFEAIFVPWFWSDEYQRQVLPDFTITDEEQEESRLYGLSLEQLAWRRAKIDELRDPRLFKQELPGHCSRGVPVQRLRLVYQAGRNHDRKGNCEAIGPLVIGADPARFGDDRFSLAWRQGRKISKIESRSKFDTVSGANWIKQVIDVDKPARMFIDLGGVGAGTFDILQSWVRRTTRSWSGSSFIRGSGVPSSLSFPCTENPPKKGLWEARISLHLDEAHRMYCNEVISVHGSAMNGKRVGLYLRVSTGDQTIENQRQALAAACEARGWRIVETFEDPGISGSKGRDRRPGFDRLHEAVTRRKVDVVAAWSVDRLGRSLQDLVGFLAELNAAGCDLYLERQAVDTTTPAGRALFQMLGVFAEFERSIIIERINAGIARARVKGTKSGAPIGRAKLDPQKTKQVRELLRDGNGIRKTARLCGTGVSAVQRIKREAAASA